MSETTLLCPVITVVCAFPIWHKHVFPIGYKCNLYVAGVLLEMYRILILSLFSHCVLAWCRVHCLSFPTAPFSFLSNLETFSLNGLVVIFFIVTAFFLSLFFFYLFYGLGCTILSCSNENDAAQLLSFHHILVESLFPLCAFTNLWGISREETLQHTADDFDMPKCSKSRL